MVKFSKREDYGMILIAKLYQNYGKKLTPLSEVAREYKISLLFLRQLANNLRKANLISALEGRNGGYELQKSPRLIKIGEVITALSGKSILECCEPGKNKKCALEKFCPSGFAWRKLNNQFLEQIYPLTLEKFFRHE